MTLIFLSDNLNLRCDKGISQSRYNFSNNAILGKFAVKH